MLFLGNRMMDLLPSSVERMDGRASMNDLRAAHWMERGKAPEELDADGYPL
jgi:hypothetical protein